MAKTIIEWSWDEAFDKFGFDDGDGIVMTGEVADFLESKGYRCDVDAWGMHNTVIMEMKKDGVNVIPSNAEHGCQCPSTYLPKEVVEMLNAEFGPVSGNMDKPKVAP
jgi:hypothetical protein